MIWIPAFELRGEFAVSSREATGTHYPSIGGEGEVRKEGEGESEENELGSFCAHGGKSGSR